MTTQLTHLHYLQFVSPRQAVCYGGDQDWFRGFWQRKAGCGPTTGAHLMHYLSKTGRLRLPLEASNSQAGFLGLMELSWGYLTPTLMGLNAPHLMQEGLDAFFARQGSGLLSRVLKVPSEVDVRPSAKEAADFITEGLRQDSPVAFLNLSNGEITHLESWHWVTVVGIQGDGDQATLQIYDNGNQLEVHLSTWLNTTKRGGGFVYAEQAQQQSA